MHPPIPYPLLFGLSPIQCMPIPQIRKDPFVEELDLTVPPELFAMNKTGKSRAEYSALIARRHDAIVEMLRYAGALGVATLAEAFGIIDQSMYKEVQKLRADGRVQPVPGTVQPIMWRAVKAGDTQ